MRHIQVGKRVNPRNASSAGDVLLAAAVIAGIQWLVIHYLASNTTLVWVPLVFPRCWPATPWPMP